MTDINELAQRAAERFGIDGEAVVDIARTYLKQGAEAVGDDPRLIDEDDLTDEQIDTVMTAIEAEMGNAHAADEQDLAELGDLRDRIALLEEELARIAEERDRIVRRLLANAVVPVKDVAEAAGLTRARIYQIRDGRR